MPNSNAPGNQCLQPFQHPTFANQKCTNKQTRIHTNPKIEPWTSSQNEQIKHHTHNRALGSHIAPVSLITLLHEFEGWPVRHDAIGVDALQGRVGVSVVHAAQGSVPDDGANLFSLASKQMINSWRLQVWSVMGEFIYWRLIAQLTTHGHLRAFHKFKFHT